jgi:hypothetical protein
MKNPEVLLLDEFGNSIHDINGSKTNIFINNFILTIIVSRVFIVIFLFQYLQLIFF